MKLKLFLMLFFVSFYTLQASIVYKLVKVDKKDILQKICLNKDGNKSTLVVVTKKSISGKIRFTPYIIKLNNGEIESKIPVKLNFIESNPFAEKWFDQLTKIDETKFLLFSSSLRNGVNSSVLRVVSINGSVLNEKVIENCLLNNLNATVDKGIIYLSYQNFNTNQLHFQSYDGDLTLKGDIQLRPEQLNTNFNGFIANNNFLYIISTNNIRVDADLKNSQLKIQKLNMSTSTLAGETNFINPKLHRNFRYLKTEKGIEIVCWSTDNISRPIPNKFSWLVLPWESNELKYHQSRFYIESFLVETKFNDSTSVLPLNYMTASFNFQVVKEPNGNFTIAIRSGTKGPSISESSFENGRYTTNTYGTAFFQNSKIITFDSTFNNLYHKIDLKNSYGAHSFSGPWEFINVETLSGYGQFVVKSDTSIAVLFYLTGIEGMKNKLNIKLRKNNVYESIIYEIDLKFKEKAKFKISSFEELTPGKFGMIMNHSSRGGYLLLFEFD